MDFITYLINLPILSRNIIRYSNTVCAKPEDLKQHIYEVVLVSYLLADNYTKSSTHCIDLDYKSLYEKALFHDTEEFITGDIPRDTKYYNAEVKKSMDSVADQIMKVFCSRISNHTKSDKIYELWRDCKENPEGLLIKLADMICVLKKLYEEISIMNNYHFYRVYRELKGHFAKLKESLKASIKDFSKDEKMVLHNGFLRYCYDVICNMIGFLNKIRISDKELFENSSVYSILKQEGK